MEIDWIGALAAVGRILSGNVQLQWSTDCIYKSFVLGVVLTCWGTLHGQQTEAAEQNASMMQISSPTKDMQARVQTLEQEVFELKQLVRQLQASQPAQQPALNAGTTSSIAITPTGSVTANRDAIDAVPTPVLAAQADSLAGASAISADDRRELDFLHNTTINLGLDTYYEYNFNNPVGRVNLLRAYDVLSNEFSLNQASMILEHAPDVAAGRRWGGRLDLQFGQATDTSQGNPSNEPRPEIYRNIFQAYGTYVAPLGKGLNIDFGKWSSSIGIEGNYTKDQMNYSRAFWFDFLPFYHMGVRVSYPVSDRFSLNYWIVNGTNQVEATNGFKDELFGFTAKPVKSLTWTMNYYLGQEHPDRAPATNCGPIPVQPGLCFAAISPAPNGHTNIFDSYALWQATPKLTLAIEGDYFIQRLWQNAAPGESSAPSRVDGGAAYIQYQLTPRITFATRAEYMSDRGGLFSGLTQALKENTVTFDYRLADGFLMRYEWRRDFSNQPSFLTATQGLLSKDQNTATLGLVWWWGRKEGTW
ncbi:MAG TPA: porin [Candidatus Sulfotelmatobacter sp.]|nr:porin [Candidatus Sulfotelmatobacter sp.]